MVKINILLLFVAFATSQVGLAEVDKKVFLTIHYESLCSDSKSFILNELKPAMHFMHDYLTLQLVPFGKASSINGGHHGFRCQHGPDECLGNMVQDCVLNLMSSWTDMEKVQYVVCEMESKAGSRGDLQCVQNANVPAQLIQDCVSSGLGTALQLKSESLTRQVQPTFIPTITIDRVFNQENQNNAMKDLIGTLCYYLKDIKPCDEYYNAQALLRMMG